MAKNYRVDFRSRNADQKNFHKAFTFTLASNAAQAARKIIEVRPGEEVEILKVEQVSR